MPLSRQTTRVFYRRLYSSELETIYYIRRDPGQKSGHTTTYKLFDCRRSRITRNKEPLQNDMTANHNTTWHIPKFELDRVGIKYVSSLDRIVQTIPSEKGWTWQPEADSTSIYEKLFGNMISVVCLRRDPPDATV